MDVKKVWFRLERGRMYVAIFASAILIAIVAGFGWLLQNRINGMASVTEQAKENMAWDFYKFEIELSRVQLDLHRAAENPADSHMLDVASTDYNIFASHVQFFQNHDQPWRETTSFKEMIAESVSFLNDHDPLLEIPPKTLAADSRSKLLDAMDILRSHIHGTVLESEKVQYFRQISRYVELGKLSLYYGILSTALLLATVTWGIFGVIKLIQAQQNHRKLEESSHELYEGATHDSLTKLPNRRFFNDRLGQTIAAIGRTGRYAALIFLDLDNFKPLNDTHGHNAGDLLLIEAAKRLRSCVREVDCVARFGGDEFVVLLCELDFSPEESRVLAVVIAKQILSTLSAPYQLAINKQGNFAETIQHQCTASLGVTIFSDNARSLQEVLDQADIAMYRAKSEGRNSVHFYQPEFPKV